MGVKSRLTINDIKNSACGHLNPHLTAEAQIKPKESKYRNKATEVNGIRFDSKREANRYKELLLLLKAGEIRDLELQKEYELNQGGTHSLKYIADFVYVTKEGKTIVEDSKGAKTAVYLKKRRLMKKLYGIVIKET
jgi:hypothetical protein